jgi:septal ring factor EnvC (AmiA/AmiB activator)
VGARARQTSYPLYFEADASVEALFLAFKAGKIKGFLLEVGNKTLTQQDWAHVVQDLMDKLAAAKAAEAKLKEQVKDLEAEKAQVQGSLVASQKDHCAEVHDLQAEMQKIKRVNRALLAEVQGDEIQPEDDDQLDDEI